MAPSRLTEAVHVNKLQVCGGNVDPVMDNVVLFYCCTNDLMGRHGNTITFHGGSPQDKLGNKEAPIRQFTNKGLGDWTLFK